MFQIKAPIQQRLRRFAVVDRVPAEHFGFVRKTPFCQCPVHRWKICCGMDQRICGQRSKSLPLEFFFEAGTVCSADRFLRDDYQTPLAIPAAAARSVNTVFGIYSLAVAGVGQSVITAPPGSCSFEPFFLCQPVN